MSEPVQSPTTEDAAVTPAPAADAASADLQAIQGVLLALQSQFEGMSEGILQRIDQMGERLNDLEHTINGLQEQIDQAQPPASKD
mmetsp:Transcript_1559/g.3667  ORF Transcript_1559/g.3667 Transcript_1559/m.3667 type:complete len:85 (+) Transcript_1559:24-278(+)|eukprot:CAMPEP_0174230492 /NCGR_PEP_ID=MMETSP0417-20130205/1242_1 /TAXON_ID=242541 /ORGANISM="Mayorella sp, Strain BSH-02190019" /LENGTH=84 /DNA_ID=CAMNT_0015308191 /DNA_START=20 /DNA_END=274 /DNA_ORIENTATION=-